jgi:hypothetical protein
MATMNSLNPSRTVVDLNGDWERHIHDKLVEIVQVPSSLRPLGVYRLQRSFLMPRLANGQRGILHLDAITYYGRVFVNGHELGSMIPYLPHEFDFTQYSQEGRNLVAVEITDAAPAPDGAGKDEVAFGFSGGWESYGGIIRDVYAEVRAGAFVDSVRFAYQLSNGYASAACTTKITVSSTTGSTGDLELALFWGPTEVARASKAMSFAKGATEVELAFEVKDLALWSPEDPNLYELKATVKTSMGEDQWSCQTGFREIKTHGRDFMLNGKRLVLNGVCRHDMWKDQGFTLTRQQQEHDMRMIKAMGCNFVRLVHYPHDHRIVRLAGEIGLLVSEEPGFWNMDFDRLPASEIDLGCQILEGVIRRDWNCPAVGFWLLGNECKFPVSYLKRGKALCDQLDPIHRLVSVAHTYGTYAEVKQTFDDGGLDFYDWHAYEYQDDKFVKLPEMFGPSKPLTLTEWGWEDAGHGDIFYELDFDGLLDQVEAGKIAGHSFWSWNDMRQYTREDWPTHNGILLSGAVTENREIREPIYSRLAGLFAGRRELAKHPLPTSATVLPLKSVPFLPGSSFQVVDLQKIVESPTGQQTWTGFESTMGKFWQKTDFASDQWKRTGGHFLLWQESRVEIGGAAFQSPVVNEYVRPLMLTAEAPDVTIPIGQDCTTLHILGQVTFPGGYPATGKHGEQVATYTLQYEGGKTQDLPVRNGMEVAQANRIFVATRVTPVASATQPALHFVKDIVREQYQVLLWSVPVEPGSKLAGLRCKLNAQQSPLAIFAITAERSSV